MRVFDRDLIRAGHYGQRSCEPHLQAEHMAAPTKPANVKKALANSEPSTHGTTRTWRGVRLESAMRPKTDIDFRDRSISINCCATHAPTTHTFRRRPWQKGK